MDFRALRVFVTLARTSSFTATADKLHMTQPTVSKLVRQLEERLGHSLFQRSTRRVHLTSAGLIALEHAEAILAQIRRMERQLQDMNEVTTGELRLGVVPLGPRFFVSLISTFKQRYPGVELKLVEDGSRVIEAKLIDGELEIGAMVAPIDKQRFDSCMVIHDRLALVAPARSRWSRVPEVRMRDLEDETLILFTNAFVLNQRIMDACHQAGFKPHIAGRSTQTSLILEMVRMGVGVVLLPRTEIQQLDRSEFAVCALVDPVLEWSIEFGWLKDACLSPAAKKWIETIDNVCITPEGGIPPED